MAKSGILPCRAGKDTPLSLLLLHAAQSKVVDRTLTPILLPGSFRFPERFGNYHRPLRDDRVSERLCSSGKICEPKARQRLPRAPYGRSSARSLLGIENGASIAATRKSRLERSAARRANGLSSPCNSWTRFRLASRRRSSGRSYLCNPDIGFGTASGPFLVIATEINTQPTDLGRFGDVVRNC